MLLDEAKGVLYEQMRKLVIKQEMESGSSKASAIPGAKPIASRAIKKKHFFYQQHLECNLLLASS